MQVSSNQDISCKYYLNNISFRQENQNNFYVEVFLQD